MIEKKIGEYTLYLNKEVDCDTNCLACAHQFVCKGSKSDFCANYNWIKTVPEVGHYGPCLNCRNRETKQLSAGYCFKCRHFMELEK